MTVDKSAVSWEPSERLVMIVGNYGSGKTEVYLRAARRVLADSGGVIVLVAEIGLLPQATARYRRMFGEQVAIIHSRLTGPERFDIWERVEKGEYRIAKRVAGAAAASTGGVLRRDGAGV